MMSNPQKGKWFKFNDTVVEEFEMTEDSLEAECFGGTYKAKILEPSKTFLSNLLIVTKWDLKYTYEFQCNKTLNIHIYKSYNWIWLSVMWEVV